MQVPFWLFLTSICIALTWQDMSALLARRSFPTILTSIKPLLPLRIARTIQTPLQLQNQANSFSTTSSNMSAQQFFDIAKKRRSIYPLKKESPIDDKKIQDIVNQAILHVPTSFNSQTTRIVLLLKDEHTKLWDITKEVLKAIVPADQYASTEQKLSMFQGAYGTVRLNFHPLSSFPLLLPIHPSLQSTFPLPTHPPTNHPTNTHPSRSSSTKTPPSSAPSKRNSPSTPSASQSGPRNPTE